MSEEERVIVAFFSIWGYQSDEIGSMMEQNPVAIRSKKSQALGKNAQCSGIERGAGYDDGWKRFK